MNNIRYVKLYEEFVQSLNENENKNITVANYEEKLYSKTPEEFLGILYNLKINQMYEQMDLDVRKIMTAAFLKAFSKGDDLDIQGPTKLGIKISRDIDSSESYIIVLDDSITNVYKQWEVFNRSLFNIPIFHIPDYTKPDVYSKKPTGTLGAFLGFDPDLNRDNNILTNTFNYVTASEEKQTDVKVKVLGYKDNIPADISNALKDTFVSNYLPIFKSIAKKVVKPEEPDVDLADANDQEDQNEEI